MLPRSSISSTSLRTLAVKQPEHEADRRITTAVRKEYSRLTQEQQSFLQAQFLAMDTDGNGTVSLQELRTYIFEKLNMRNDDQTRIRLGWLFTLVDANRDGQLDFFEAGALLLLLKSGRCFCTHCNEVLFTDCCYVCPTCWLGPATSNSHNSSPTFCTDCYDMHAVALHPHPLHLVRNEFLKPPAQWSFVSQLQLTCCCCHIGHNCAALGYLWPERIAHIMPRDDGTYVCEFCATWMCRECGTTKADVQDPRPDQWLGQWKCEDRLSCRPDNRIHAFSDNMIRAMAMDDGRSHCASCRVRILSNRHKLSQPTAADARPLTNGGGNAFVQFGGCPAAHGSNLQQTMSLQPAGMRTSIAQLQPSPSCNSQQHELSASERRTQAAREISQYLQIASTAATLGTTIGGNGGDGDCCIM